MDLRQSARGPYDQICSAPRVRPLAGAMGIIRSTQNDIRFEGRDQLELPIEVGDGSKSRKGASDERSCDVGCSQRYQLAIRTHGIVELGIQLSESYIRR